MDDTTQHLITLLTLSYDNLPFYNFQKALASHMLREILAFTTVIMAKSDFSASNNKVLPDLLFEPNSSVELDSSLELDPSFEPEPTGLPPVSIFALNLVESKFD